MLPHYQHTTANTRRKRINGSYQATRLIFSKLWRSRIKLPEAIIVGKDGVIEQWLFFSKDARCLLRKAYDTLNDGKGHDRLLQKFKPVSLNGDGAPCLHVIAPGGRAVFCRKGFKSAIQDLKEQHDLLIEGLTSGGQSIQRTIESVDEQDLSSRSIGEFIATKFTPPSGHCVFVAEIIRNPNRPANMVEARRMGKHLIL
jgi:hypothetical protein